VVRLAESTGARIAWVPRWAGERGAVPPLLPAADWRGEIVRV